MKVYAFSRTGAAKDVVITGSANMTDRAVSLQWNDLYTMNDEAPLYSTFVHVFNQLKHDRKVSPRWITFHDGIDRRPVLQDGGRRQGGVEPAGSRHGRCPSCPVPSVTRCSSG